MLLIRFKSRYLDFNSSYLFNYSVWNAGVSPNGFSKNSTVFIDVLETCVVSIDRKLVYFE